MRSTRPCAELRRRMPPNAAEIVRLCRLARPFSCLQAVCSFAMHRWVSPSCDVPSSVMRSVSVTHGFGVTDLTARAPRCWSLVAISVAPLWMVHSP